MVKKEKEKVSYKAPITYSLKIKPHSARSEKTETKSDGSVTCPLEQPKILNPLNRELLET